MKLVVYSFSNNGGEIAESLLDIGAYEITHKRSKDFKIAREVESDFKEYDALIFISSTGIAVRMISKYIVSKEKDPAVLVIDDMGKFTISLLSGHIGGANELTLNISKVLCNIPVFTTATDGRGIEAVDVFAKRKGYEIDSLLAAKEVMSLRINNGKIYCYSETGDYPRDDGLIKSGDFKSKEADAWIYISSNLRDFKRSVCKLIPRNINVGIGCRRGTKISSLESVMLKAFDLAGLDIRGIKEIASIEEKKDEEGIIELANKYGVNFTTFTREEINSVKDLKEKSDFVKDTMGVYAVSEPSAILLGGRLILSKYKDKGVTISITKEEVGNEED